MPLAIFCNNPLSVSIVFERRAKYSGEIFKDSLHFQWWAGNFNFTFERVQHTFNENPAWSDIFLLNDITYKKILRYIFQVQSPISRSHHVIRARRSKRVVRNVVKTLFIVKREARENKEPTPHAPPPLCFEFFFWIANNLKKAILFCCTKQSDKSNNCYVVSFRNIERNLVSNYLMSVGSTVGQTKFFGASGRHFDLKIGGGWGGVGFGQVIALLSARCSEGNVSALQYQSVKIFFLLQAHNQWIISNWNATEEVAIPPMDLVCLNKLLQKSYLP